MLNIKFMGEYKSDDQLIKRKEIPAEAVEFGIVDTLAQEFGRGLIILLPLFALMVLLTLLRIKQLNYKLHFDLPFIISFILVIVCVHLLTYVHEIIHTLFYPKEAEKTIWRSLEQGAYFVYCEELVSRNRFIVMALAPMFILGIIPFIIWLIFPAVIPMPYNLAAVIVTWLMTIMAMGDVANVYHVLKEVPKNAKVFNYGLLRSFYIMEK